MKSDSTQDKRTWIIGGKEENKGREKERFRSFSNAQNTERPGNAESSGTTSAVLQPPVDEREDLMTMHDTQNDTGMMGADPSAATDDVMSSLAGLDMGGTTLQEAPLLDTVGPVAQTSIAPQSTVPEPAPVAMNPSISTSAALAAMSLTKGPDIEKWLERLIYNTEGVLYEDEQLQIGIKAEYHGHLGRLAIYIGNKIPQPFANFSATIETAEPSALKVEFHKPPAPEIAGLAQVQYLLQIECKSVFTTLPILKISFIAGTVRNLNLKLPVFLSKFVEPVTLDSAAFFERWKVIGGELEIT